jgi:thiol:disulfide interchange protein DsbD
MKHSIARCRRALGALAFLFLGAGAACGPAFSAALPDQAATAQVSARLVAAADAVHPGEQVLLGIEQRIAPHWHTYWINPGDTGMPTRIAWSLPSGATAGAIQWPAPARFQTGTVTSYGYENQVTLLSTVTVPADLEAGSSFPIKATVSWLVCKDVCIPQQVELGLVLPVRAPQAAVAPGLLQPDAARAALPVDAPWPVRAQTDGRRLLLQIGDPALARHEDIWFYAEQRDRVAPGAAQAPRIEAGKLLLGLHAGEAPAAPGEHLRGVLVVKRRAPDAHPTGTAAQAYTIDTVLAEGMPAELEAQAAGPGLPGALLLAMLGGLVLNLMPCVFPVLSIKALSLLEHARQAPRVARLHGIAYTLGVLLSFGLLGGVLVVLKAGGAELGWGFQFQSPWFGLAMAWLLFAVGLNLSGGFEVGAPSLAGVGSSLAARSGYAGSFFTGVLATIVATPCTAPFMGGAIGYALSQPPAVLISVLLCMGLGLALPYLLLSTWPVLRRWLPRPGAWMERVRQGLAFPMYAAAAWLVWILARQAGADAVPAALGGMVAIAFAAWIRGVTRSAQAPRRHGGSGLAALALAAAFGAGFKATVADPEAAPAGATQPGAAAPGEAWSPYSAERLQALRARGEPVFVNLTAAWCITCLVNERVALNQGAVAAAFEQAGVTYLKGDWTNQDQAITRLLARFGRSGVPLYVFFPAGLDASPVVLPQLLTPDLVIGTVKAGAAQGR